MAVENRQFGRRDLLIALEQGWQHYLAHLHELSEEEQTLYARKQGFTRVQDVLAHVVAWWERSIQRSLQIINGQAVPRANDMDEFNAEVVAQYQQWTREAIEAKFVETLTTFERFSSKGYQRTHLRTSAYSSGCVSTPLIIMKIIACPTLPDCSWRKCHPYALTNSIISCEGNMQEGSKHNTRLLPLNNDIWGEESGSWWPLVNALAHLFKGVAGIEALKPPGGTGFGE